VLLHGEPGTGKTLLVRALVEECSRMGGTPVAFFSRKGADCLGKYSGDAERLLRLLFKEAEDFSPSVIFFDEMDGLVPVRGGGTGEGDQVCTTPHASSNPCRFTHVVSSVRFATGCKHLGLTSVFTSCRKPAPLSTVHVTSGTHVPSFASTGEKLAFEHGRVSTFSYSLSVHVARLFV